MAITAIGWPYSSISLTPSRIVRNLMRISGSSYSVRIIRRRSFRRLTIDSRRRVAAFAYLMLRDRSPPSALP